MKYIVEALRGMFMPIFNKVKGVGDAAWNAILKSPMGEMVEQYLKKKGIGTLAKPIPLLSKVGAKGIAVIGGLVNLMFALSRLKEGDPIGAIGATGRATGPHLDWRMSWFNQRIDPQLLVPPMP